MINWYVVYYDKNDHNADEWFASSPDRSTAEAWVLELERKGYTPVIDVVRAPSERDDQ